MSVLFYKNQFGSVSLTIEDNIMVAQFKGAISSGIVSYFIKASEVALTKIKTPHWGYVSYSEQADAATPDALKELFIVGQNFHNAGCVKSAYVLKSAIAISQVKKLRDSINVTEPLSDVLFDELEDAKQFVSEYLKSYQPN
ncbi:hypothetical protein RT723_15460 [Psychrosphaera aquimarina]|uniref:Uncharacterized protein n=1 Tax=Psychrosphaera aquimarina TaxID=2044854 RepID=A0ABU3R3Y5_9GAMM|nr:hypothetical protein [Psychrosphaera aquimarina]MDU0114363.1 hypothetical protein [Psychrosphaera aquimarina]